MEEWNVVSDLSHFFFFTAPHFLLALEAASVSHFVTAATKFSCCSSNKKMSPVFFLSLSRSLSPFFSLSFARLPLFLFFSVFLLLYIPNLWTWQYISKLNTLGNTEFSLSVFVFIDSFVVSALQDAGGYAISRQNNLELHLGCHTCWLSYFTLVCLWCRRTVGRTVTWLPNFLG